MFANMNTKTTIGYG